MHRANAVSIIAFLIFSMIVLRVRVDEGDVENSNIAGVRSLDKFEVTQLVALELLARADLPSRDKCYEGRLLFYRDVSGLRQALWKSRFRFLLGGSFGLILRPACLHWENLANSEIFGYGCAESEKSLGNNDSRGRVRRKATGWQPVVREQIVVPSRLRTPLTRRGYAPQGNKIRFK